MQSKNDNLVIPKASLKRIDSVIKIQNIFIKKKTEELQTRFQKTFIFE